MRIVTGILCALMLLFAAVQYNDPDGLFWAAVYGTGAVWSGLVCLKQEWLQHRIARVLLVANLAAAGAGMVYFWPKSKSWWSVDVWWTVESAREGMGMMILVIVLVIVLYYVNKIK